MPDDELPDHADPIELLLEWHEHARTAGQPHADAMTLATATRSGAPAARLVLFKGVHEGGLCFYTNTQSAKARQIEENPQAAAVFHFLDPHRQVRLEGPVEALPAQLCDTYWATRPRESQIGAWASPQSRPVASREELDRWVAEARERFADGPIPRPDHWGGYRLIPERVEIWIGREHRLHDRLEYSLGKGGWRRQRLAP